jgi:hypothetical protein
MPTFSPAQAYWNQRVALSNARDRILSLAQAVDQRSDLLPYQWAQLMAAALDFAPDLILELGRGRGNSTCAFTEASNINGPLANSESVLVRQLGAGDPSAPW